MLREIIVNLIILCGPSPTCHLVSISITKCVTFFCTSYNSVVNTSPPSCLNLTESLFLLFTYASYNYLKSYRHETKHDMGTVKSSIGNINRGIS